MGKSRWGLSLARYQKPFSVQNTKLGSFLFPGIDTGNLDVTAFLSTPYVSWWKLLFLRLQPLLGLSFCLCLNVHLHRKELDPRLFWICFSADQFSWLTDSALFSSIKGLCITHRQHLGKTSPKHSCWCIWKGDQCWASCYQLHCFLPYCWGKLLLPGIFCVKLGASPVWTDWAWKWCDFVLCLGGGCDNGKWRQREWWASVHAKAGDHLLLNSGMHSLIC